MQALKKTLLVLASAMLLPATASAVLSTPNDADVAAVRTYVEKNRSYSPAARAEASARLALLPALVGDPARFDLEAAHIAALADNGHSVLLAPQWASRYPRSEVHLALFSDGLFVIAAPGRFRTALGNRVIEINGRPWQAVRAAYSRYQGGEQSFRDQFVTLFMETPALLRAGGLGSDPASLRLTLQAPGGRPRTLNIPTRLTPFEGDENFLGHSTLLDAAETLAPAARPLYLQQPDRPSRLEFSTEFDGAYIQLKEIRGSGLAAFLTDSLAQLGARRPHNIVVDLRFNMGGDLNMARDFMQALPALADGGHLYAITSGRTFSAAISSLGYLKQAAGSRLTIVGEPIGDRLEFWAEGDIVELPGLGAMMLYATERHNYRTGCPEADCHASIRNHPIRVTSLAPDIPAPLRFVDFVAGRDPSMDAIIRDIRRARITHPS